MSRPFEVHLPLEQGYLRHSLFAIELLDAVTLSRAPPVTKRLVILPPNPAPRTTITWQEITGTTGGRHPSRCS